MIYTYGFSIEGSSHKSQEKPCQDANKIVCLDDGAVIAAVADGVGSCKYSDVASQLAVDTAVDYCVSKIESGVDKGNLLNLIQEAYMEAESAIDKRSASDNKPLSEYDTTLSMVIYDGKLVTYGHCGDGGIVGLTTKGDYLKITTPQKTDGIYVIPLRAGKDTWVFGQVEDEVASVLLATDGVYDTFFPYLLKDQPVEVYVPLIRYFMDSNGIGVADDTIGKIGKDREHFINSDACASITDDKTLLVLINGDIKPELKDKPFYVEPDWEALQMEWNKKAYPHLYKDEATTIEERNG